MASTANWYRIIDDFTNTSFAGGAGGGMGGQPLMDFTHSSLANAAQVAYLLSSVLCRPVRLASLNQFPVIYTLITGIGPANALTSVPSGVSY